MAARKRAILGASSAESGIEVRRADSRFRTRTDGTDTWHSFSFGEHYDPANVSFGPLLVHNDDLVQTEPATPTTPTGTPRS